MKRSRPSLKHLGAEWFDREYRIKGRTLRSIGDELNVSYEAVRARMQLLGVSRRRPARRPTDAWMLRKAEILAGRRRRARIKTEAPKLRDEGLSLRAIAQRFGVSAGAIVFHLKKPSAESNP